MAENGAAWLQIQGVTHRYGQVVALDDVSLEIGEGELSRCSAVVRQDDAPAHPRRLHPAGRGRVVLQGRISPAFLPTSAPSTWSSSARRCSRISTSSRTSRSAWVAGVAKGNVEERVKQALALVQLPGYERRRAHELSGGQQRVGALARARQPAACPAPRRAALRARSQDPARDGGGAAPRPPRDRRDVRLRHARSARGARPVRPDRRPRPGPIEQLGTPDRSTGSRRRRSRPGSSATRTSSRWRSSDTVAVAAVTLAGQSLSVPCEAELPAGDAWLVLRPEVVRLGAPDGAGLRGTVRDLAFRIGLRLPARDRRARRDAEGGGAGGGGPAARARQRRRGEIPDSCVLLPRAG